MKNRQKKVIYWIIAVVAIVGGIWAINFYTNQPSPLDAFAQCLDEEGATFYGAFWCPACNQQKALFGNSKGKIPYTECSLPNRNNGQTQVCIDAGISGYPTWEFSDGERTTGVMTLEELAQKTNCELPS